MMKKKKMSLLIFLSVLAFVICGCADHSGKKAKSDSGAEDVSQDKEMQNGGQDGDTPEYTKPEMKGELRISCFIEPEFLEPAAKQFMEQYPDVKIVINGYMEQSNTPREDEYQTSFNTGLMSGDGADIVFNSFLPVTTYGEMGAFEDLSTYISQTPEMNDENYYMNVLKAAQNKDGKIYIIPYQAFIETFGFSTELLKEHEDIENALRGKENICFSEVMDFAKRLVEGKNPGENVFLIGSRSTVQIMQDLINDSRNDFIEQEKKEVHLDTEKYMDLLNSVKNIVDEGWLNMDEFDFYNTEYYIAASPSVAMDAAAAQVNPQSKMSCFMPLADKQGNVAVNANNCIALNSSSEHKELAWEFIKYLLSDKVQSLPSVSGLSVNRKGFEKSVERWYNSHDISGSLEDYRNLLQDWVEQVNTCDMLDGPIKSLLELENEKFFDGQQTAEETAKTLQKQIEQYLNE